ncbi:MAG: hypothetical protein U1F43_28420 [Myxococcota bacterium]
MIREQPLLALALLAACSSGREARITADAVTTIDTATATETASPADTETTADDVAVAVDSASETAAADSTAPVADTAVADAAPDVAEPGPWPTTCALEGDSDTVPLPEASGAAMLDSTHVLVVADSGNKGRAIVYDLVAKTARELVLPLGEGAGDDVENLSRGPDGRIWGLTSAGFLRAWRADGEGFALDVGPIAVAPEGDWRCAADGVNCAANFEGLCLDPAPADGACAGWAASKAKGLLVCLVADGSAFRVDATRTIPIAPADQLSDCAFEPTVPHRLVAAGNVYSGSSLWEVDPVKRTATAFSAVGAPNQEAIVVAPGGHVHSFGDLQDLTPDSPHLVLACGPAPSATGGGASEP